jgi:hypothetical protein
VSNFSLSPPFDPALLEVFAEKPAAGHLCALTETQFLCANSHLQSPLGLRERSMSEQRRHIRRRVLKAAKIAFNRGSVIDCTVRNISERGALLQVASPIGIPDRFDLLFDSEHESRKCRTVWRKESQIGVEFCDAA